MAKRFIDTDIFKKQFLRGLQAPYKLLWVYIMTDCNHAGIWECDFEVAGIRLGIKVDYKTAVKVFLGKVVELDENSKWFIPSFIEFQYGKLSENNRAHIQVISILKKRDLLDAELSPKNIYPKPLTSPLQGDKDMEKEKEKDKEKEKEQAKDTKKEFCNPFGENFLPHWVLWKKYKKEQYAFTYKSAITEQAAINSLVKLSNGNDLIAKEIIEQSMAKGWQGLFELKNNKNGKSNQNNGYGIDEQKLKEETFRNLRTE